jgi:hypothetical protein
MPALAHQWTGHGAGTVNSPKMTHSCPQSIQQVPGKSLPLLLEYGEGLQ